VKSCEPRRLALDSSVLPHPPSPLGDMLAMFESFVPPCPSAKYPRMVYCLGTCKICEETADGHELRTLANFSPPGASTITTTFNQTATATSTLPQVTSTLGELRSASSPFPHCPVSPQRRALEISTILECFWRYTRYVRVLFISICLHQQTRGRYMFQGLRHYHRECG
jgi:hypothetical protein